MLYDNAELLNQIQKRGLVPTQAGAWSTQDMLDMAASEIESNLLPLVINARGEYLVQTKDVPVASGQQTYQLTYRAAAIREMSYYRADGVELTITEMAPNQMTQLGLQRTRQGTPKFYTFHEDRFDLWPIPPTTNGDYIRVKFHIRPNRLTPSTGGTGAVQITGVSIGATNTTLTHGAAASPLTSATVVDLVRGYTPFPIIGFDLTTVGSPTTTTVIANSAMPAAPGNVAIGDWVCTKQLSPVMNLPAECLAVVALRAASTILKSKDAKLAAALAEEAQEKEARLIAGILQPRSRGNSKKLASRRWDGRGGY